MLNKIELANKICLAKKSYLVYDNANSRLFYYDDWYARIVDIQPNDFKGKKLIDFVPVWVVITIRLLSWKFRRDA
ncbi:MAG: hypothetical protein ACLU4N_19195 [Butyricimonas faecihominis]